MHYVEVSEFHTDLTRHLKFLLCAETSALLPPVTESLFRHTVPFQQNSIKSTQSSAKSTTPGHNTAVS